MWKKVLFSLLPLALLLMSGEGILRLLPSANPDRIAAYMAEWESERGGEFWTLSPGIGINQHGLRDLERDFDRPVGTWRVAALGDSVTLGYKISRRQAWPAQLERLLSRDHRHIEVFNVSVVGWAARQERIAYEEIVSRYGVHDVLLGVCLNDVPEMQNNIRISDVPEVLLWLNRHSVAFRLLLGAQAREITQVEELFSHDGSARVERGWQLLFDEILGLRDRLSQDRVRLVVILFPFRFQVREDAPSAVAQQRMSKFCDANGISCVDVLEPLKKLGPEAFVDYDHLSASGSRRVARHIYESGVLQSPIR